MEKVENDLSGAASSDDANAASEEGKKHAEKIRDSVRDLPSIGAGSESSSGKAAAAREHAEQMARALEEGSPADAVASGHSALQALEESKRAARTDPGTVWTVTATKPRRRPTRRGRSSSRRSTGPSRSSSICERRRPRGRAGSSQDAEEENKMAEQTRQLGEKGRDQMPSGALDALDEAEKSMQRAADGLRVDDPDRAMEHQREAQRQLEMARQAMGSQDEGNEQGESQGEGDGQDFFARADRDPERGRAQGAGGVSGQRVTKGLSQPANGRLKDAVRRYAEGLLR